MRLSLILCTLLMLSMFAVFPLSSPADQSTSLGLERMPFAAAGDSSLDLIITDAGGAPVVGATVEVVDGWTDLLVSGPTVMSGSRLVIEDLPAGPMRIHVTHVAYASGFAPVVLNATGVTISTMALIPLDSTLQISTAPEASLTLWLDGHLEPIKEVSGTGGVVSLPVTSNGSGWLHVEASSGTILTNWSGEESLSPATNGTMKLYGWPVNASTSGVLRVEHHPSGWWDLFQWSTEVDVNLPHTSSGEWRVFNFNHGVRVGQPLTFGDSAQVNITSLIDGNWSGASPTWEGGVTLNMTAGPEVGSTVNFTWEAEYMLPSDFGTALLPERSRGLAQQFDRWMGDGDGVIDSSEEAAMAMFRDSNPWAESNHMVLFDGTPMTGDVDISGQSFTQVAGEPGASDHGWSETANLTGQVGFSSTRMFWFPVRGDAIESVPITVNLPEGWEVRYSPQIELLSGTPSTFTLNRSESPTTGMWTVTIGNNQPPIANGGLHNHTGLAIPLDGEVTLASYCTDSGIGSLTHTWEVRRNGTVMDVGDGEFYPITPSGSGFSHGEELNVTLSCSDWAGMTSLWEGEYYVDGAPPTATLFAVEDHILPEPDWAHDLDNQTEFTLRAGSYLTVEANVSDDSGAPTQVIWRSNKTEGWVYHEPWFVDQFNQGDDVNWMHMGIEERYQQRELTVYSLEMELIDEAGNSAIRHWDVTISDATPPTITAEIMVDGIPIGPLNPARPDSVVTVNLTRSFDDIDAIHLVRWNATLDGEELMTDVDWYEAQFFTLPAMEVGERDLHFFARDSMNNTRELITNPVISPLEPSDIEVVSVEVDGKPIVGEEGLLKVKVRNHGENPATMIFCYLEQCSSWTSGSATSESASETVYPLAVTSYEKGPIQVMVNWSDPASNSSGEVLVDAGVSAKTENSDTLRLLFLLGMLGGAVFWLLRGRSEGSGKTPF